jgi:hypothetical protein
LAFAFYAAFDNRGSLSPAGDELRALFSAAATITRVTDDEIASWSPEAFIAPRIAMLTDGTLTEFHEWETESQTAVIGNIASRWSTYEKEGKLNGADYRGGGHKFIQLARTSGGWLISSILWEDR